MLLSEQVWKMELGVGACGLTWDRHREARGAGVSVMTLQS